MERGGVCRYLREEKGITLSPQQQAAVETGEKAVLLLAVPGSGKTTALVSRTARLILEEGQDPRRILTVTFNREAARDLGRRWDQLFGEICPQRPDFSTIHSFCYRVLRRYAALKGTQAPRVFGESDGSRRVLAAIWREQSGQSFGDDELDSLSNAIGQAANLMIPDDDLPRLFPQLPGLRELRKTYRAYKQNHGLMDFDDMLLYAHTALERYPSLLKEVREAYDWIQVDEAQDTSLLQHRILEKVCRAGIFMVGDEDQSIYRFRGAWPKALLDFGKRFPGGTVLKMEENFRSTVSLVEAAHRFIRDTPNRYDKGMRARGGEGPKPVFLEKEDLCGQYRAISRRLRELPPGQTAAVLYRSGITGAAMADRLDRDGIPFSWRESRSPLAASLIFRDLCAFFRLALDPGDLEDFFKVAYKMGCYVNRELADTLRRDPPSSVWDALVNSEQYKDRSTARLSYLQAVLRNLCRRTPQKAIQTVLDDLGYLDYLKKQGEGSYQLELWTQQLGAAMSIAGGCPDLPAFLERVEAIPAQLPDRENLPCPVCLSTVHSAKGREFDLVLVADLEEGVFPTCAAIGDEEAGDGETMEEEARIFYVAITRARRELVLFTAGGQGDLALEDSRFFRQLRDGALPARQQAAVGKLRPGMAVWHRSFGRGEINSVNRRMALFAVKFDKIGVKYFAFGALDDPQTLRILS